MAEKRRPREITFPPLTWQGVRRAGLELEMSASEFVRRSTVQALKVYRDTGAGPAPVPAEERASDA